MEKNVRNTIIDTIEKDNGFINNNNFSIVTLEDDSVVMEGIVIESSMNPYKIVHGGFIFGLADSCAGILASTTGRAAVTTNAFINYYHKATGSKLIAKSRFIKKGKLLSNVEVLVYDEHDTLVSSIMYEFCYIEEVK
jgi:uncharacterized protein (TIGR00369 family)